MPEETDELEYSAFGGISSRFGGRVGEGLSGISKALEKPDENMPRQSPKEVHAITLCIEHCTTHRPTLTLKGTPEAYTELAEKVEAAFKEQFGDDWTIDFTINPAPEKSPFPYVAPELAYSYHGRCGTAQQSFYVVDMPEQQRRLL